MVFIHRKNTFQKTGLVKTNAAGKSFTFIQISQMISKDTFKGLIILKIKLLKLSRLEHSPLLAFNGLRKKS